MDLKNQQIDFKGFQPWYFFNHSLVVPGPLFGSSFTDPFGLAFWDGPFDVFATPKSWVAVPEIF